MSQWRAYLTEPYSVSFGLREHRAQLGTTRIMTSSKGWVAEGPFILCEYRPCGSWKTRSLNIYSVAPVGGDDLG